MTDTRLYELMNNDNFIVILKQELFALIDEELAKDNDMNCDLIDELVNAIESLEQSENENPAVVIPLIFANGTHLSKHIRNKVNGRETMMRATACAAAFALLFGTVNSVISHNEGNVFVESVKEFMEDIGSFLGFNTAVSNADEPSTDALTTEPTTDEEAITPQEDIRQDQIQNAPKERRLTGIELISGDGFKSSYLYREELSLSGLRVIALYSDDSSEEIPLSDCEIWGYNSSRVGEQTVTVKYKDCTAAFKVRVTKTREDDTTSRVVTSLDVGNKETFFVPLGKNIPTVQWRYVYSDGTYSNWVSNRETLTLVSEYDSNLKNIEQILTFRVPNGMTFNISLIHYDATVEDGKTVSELKISDIPYYFFEYHSNYSEDYNYHFFSLLNDDRLDFSQFEFRVNYADKKRETLTLADGKIQVFGTMSNEEVGKYKLTFIYGNAKTTFEYEVIDGGELRDFYFSGLYWDTFHIDEAPSVEEYHPEELVWAKLENYDAEVDPIVEYKGYDPTKVGPIELDVYYKGEYIGTTFAGYIYDDESFYIASRPNFESTPYSTFPGQMIDYSVTPRIMLGYCKSQGEFMTYGEEKTGNGVGALEARGLTLYEYTSNWYNEKEYYNRNARYYLYAPEEISGYGEHEVTYTLYEPKQVNGEWVRGDVEQEFKFTHTIERYVQSYRIEAPNNIAVNIYDLQTEFYDKVKVYAIYSDGTEKEVYNYVMTRYTPSDVKTSDMLSIQVNPAGQRGRTFTVYAYNDGYEDAWYLSTPTSKPGFYTLQSLPRFSVILTSATGTTIASVPINSTAGENYRVEGFDTTVPGIHKGTVYYTHEILGEFSTEFEYEVEYYTPSMTAKAGEGMYFNPQTKEFTNMNFEVTLSDAMGETYITDNYTYEFTSERDAIITCTDPYTGKVMTQKVRIPYIPANTTIRAQRAENGEIILYFNNDFEESNTVIYTIDWKIGKIERTAQQYREKTINLGFRHLQDTEMTVVFTMYVEDADGNSYRLAYNQKYTIEIEPYSEVPPPTSPPIEDVEKPDDALIIGKKDPDDNGEQWYG